MKRLATAIASALSSLALLSTADAGDMNFGYTQSEMDSAEGREELLARLKGEVREFCRDEFRRDVPALTETQHCYRDMVSVITQQIDDSRFTALVERREPRSLFAGR